MGRFVHHAIIITAARHDDLYGPYLEAEKLFNREMLSHFVESPANGFVTLFIAPDGSKEGWDTSDKYEEKRDIFAEYMATQATCHWVEVRYGPDVPRPYIERSSEDE